MRLALFSLIAALLFTAAPAARTQVVEQEDQKLTTPGGAAFDRFGSALGLSGAALVVGAKGRPGAYLFEGGSGSWQPLAELPASGSAFGIAVAIDGQRILVGDDLADAPTQQLVGAALAYLVGAGWWAREAALRPSDGGIHDHFGAALALDGELAIVGAPEHLDGNEWGAGYVFRRGGGGWAQDELDARAKSVAIDALTIACGSPGLTGASQGRVQVFVHDGATWVQQAVLTPDDATDGNRFGTALAVLGNTLIVGADKARFQGVDTGAVYVFERAGAVWSQTAKLVPSDAESGDAFGIAVAFDGGTLVAGATGHDHLSTNSGAAWRFARGPNGWTESAKLVASDANANSFLGRSVAVEGTSVIVGADFADGAVADAGAVYVYDIALGDAYCFGDGSGTPCPCGNTGGANTGCANSTGIGATLVATGSASVAADDLAFHGGGLVPTQPALLFAALNRVGGGAGAPFGDGLRCAGGDVRRLGARIADVEGGAQWGPGLSSLGNWNPGDTRRFQLHYRDPAAGPCGAGFNLSHGLELAFGG